MSSLEASGGFGASWVPLVLAVVGSYRKGKVAVWEQEAVASGVAHALSLVLHDEGSGHSRVPGSGAFGSTGSMSAS